MNFKILRIKEMSPLTGAWLQEQREIFLSIPEVAGLLPQIEKVHQRALRWVQVTSGDEEIDRMTEALAETDAQHDGNIRVVWGGMTAAAEYLRCRRVPSLEEASRIERLRDRLLPERLAYVQKSYLEEAGNAATAFKQLDAEAEALLRRIPVMDGTMLDAVQLWAETGARLGDLERRRLLLVTELEEQESEASIRSDWSRKVNTVLSALEESDAPADHIKALREPVVDAHATAHRRRAEAAAKRAAASSTTASSAAEGASSTSEGASSTAEGASSAAETPV